MINSLNILYEDNHIIVCEKPSGIAVQSRRIGTADMESILKNHIFQKSNGQCTPYLAIIHRLDQPVRGILVFAKTTFSAKELNLQLTDGSFGKYYRTLVEGIPPKQEGILTDYMIKNGRTNLSAICDKNLPGAKLARLTYRTIKPEARFFQESDISSSLRTELEIKLDTGRHHQIRCQLAHLGCPIVGDAKYNPNAQRGTTIKLCAYKLTFKHPKTKKTLSFELPA